MLASSMRLSYTCIPATRSRILQLSCRAQTSVAFGEAKEKLCGSGSTDEKSVWKLKYNLDVPS